MLRDCNSLWNKAWPAHLYGKHLHIQVILSMLFANSNLWAQSSELGAFLKKLVWKPAGTIICCVIFPSSSPWGRRTTAEQAAVCLQGSCPVSGWDRREPCPSVAPKFGAAVVGHSSLLVWRGAQVRSKGTA